MSYFEQIEQLEREYIHIFNENGRENKSWYDGFIDTLHACKHGSSIDVLSHNVARLSEYDGICRPDLEYINGCWFAIDYVKHMED